MENRARIHEHDVMLGGERLGLFELRRVQRDGLLAHDVLAGGQCAAQVGDVGVVRRGDVDGIDVRVGEQVVDLVVDLGNPIPRREGNGLVMGPVGDARKRPALLGERRGHLVRNDAAAENPPAKLGAHR